MSADLTKLTDEDITAGLRVHAAMVSRFETIEEFIPDERSGSLLQHHCAQHRALEAEQKRRAEISVVTPERRKHQWGPTRLNHGEAQCIRCLMTNREAWVLGEFCNV